MVTDFDRKVDGKPLRIATFDIESTALDAQFGYCLCACVKEVNRGNLRGQTTTIRIDDRRNPDKFSDRWVIEELIDTLDSYDLLVGWYSSAFDIPFINTRALKYNLLPPVKKFRRDLCFVARGVGKLKNNKLATWGRYLFGHTEKTFLDWDTWLRAMRGDKKSLDYIVEHCQKDVLETEKIYKRFTPLLGKLRKA